MCHGRDRQWPGDMRCSQDIDDFGLVSRRAIGRDGACVPYLCLIYSNVVTISLFLVIGSVFTLNPTISGSTGILNGEAVGFTVNDMLEMYFKYYEGNTLPASPWLTSKFSVWAVAGTTPFPTFSVTKTCTEYTYQAGNITVATCSFCFLVLVT